MNSNGEPAFIGPKSSDNDNRSSKEQNSEPSKPSIDLGKKAWWDDGKRIIHMGPCR